LNYNKLQDLLVFEILLLEILKMNLVSDLLSILCLTITLEWIITTFLRVCTMQGWFFSFMLQHYAVSQFYTKSVRNMWSSLKLQEI